ncbi:MAG: toxin-antitoxin system YwqK family antitoxin [Bacteroidota bacterium]
MVKQKLFATLYFIFTLTLSIYAQTTVNGYDSNDKRHGIWKKDYAGTNQPRYEGQFEHGKEVGLFKFYTLNRGKSVLSATKLFNKENQMAEVKFFSSTGKLISEGKMNGKNYIGDWIFYHNKSDAVLSQEFYNKQGNLQGEKTVYYDNGQIAEVSNYLDGKLNGKNLIYAKDGTLLKSFTYKNDELHGETKYYDADGNIKGEGVYQHNRRHGIWKYYENDKLVETKDHTRRSKNPAKN